MVIQEQVPLAAYTTFGLGGPARYFAVAESEEDVAAAVAWAAERLLPLFTLGGGSNLLVRDSGFSGLVVQIAIRGIVACGPGCLDVGAGEPWESLVRFAVEHDLAGIECLAGIPGSVGGTPVQNVGAYGQEVSETILSVRAFDRQTGNVRELSHAECEFGYRSSVFNTTARGRYLVTGVRFGLQPGGAPQLRYADLQRRFEAAGTPPTLSEVAAAVRAIRGEKGMVLTPGDPDTASAGSFFKNPVVPAGQLTSIAQAVGLETSQVPQWPAGADAAGQPLIKLPAAWLLERAGFVKGYGEGPVRISSRHTLALTNRGGASFAEVEAMQETIRRGVHERFGVLLEREPVLLE